jgi:hypothetical protein
MSVVTLIVGICVLLFACWLTNSYMPVPWKVPALVVIVLLGLIWLASVFVPGLTNARVGG